MLLRSVIEILTPPACFGCASPGMVLCPDCVRTAVKPYPQRCYCCGWGNSNGRVCIFCLPSQSLTGTTVVARYNGIIREMILELKQSQCRQVADVLASLLVRAVLKTDYPVTLITCVPTSPKRYRERGHNQSALLAKAVARQFGVPYLPLLARMTSTHQVGQDRSHRFEQVKDAFIPIRKLDKRDNILLVDDVLTTGATLASAAIALRQAGASNVWGAAVARSKT